MDYEKKYNEALERAKHEYQTHKSFKGFREMLAHIFPELAENEDEKIRKELIEHCKNQAKPYIDTGNECPQIQSWIDWLEKQGEQKPAGKVEPKFKVGDEIIRSSKSSCPVHSSTDDTICKVAEIHDTCYILDTKDGKIQAPFKWQDYYELIEQKTVEWKQENVEELTEFENAMMHIGGSFFGENAGLDPNDTNAVKEQAQYLLELAQNPTWSEEDRTMAFTLMRDVDQMSYVSKEGKNERIGWLNSLDEKFASRESSWGEEDEKMFRGVTTICDLWSTKTSTYPKENDDIEKLKNWLKSLKERIGG